jgi:hypothetical protein
MKILYFFHFCGSFLPSWIRTRNPVSSCSPARQEAIMHGGGIDSNFRNSFFTFLCTFFLSVPSSKTTITIFLSNAIAL